MLNLAQIYWDWRNRPRRTRYIKTDMGFSVRKFADKWAVSTNRFSGKYYDLRSSGLSWWESSTYFRDCLGTRAEVESRFGKILDSEENKA